MGEPLTWSDESRKLSELKSRPDNPRQISEDAARRLVQSYLEYDQPQPLLINPDGTLLDGHQRLDVWIGEYGPDFEVDVRVPSRPLTQREWQRLVAYLHVGATGGWDWDRLAQWDPSDLTQWGFDQGALDEWKDNAAKLSDMLSGADVATDQDLEAIKEAASDEEIPEMELQLNESWDYLVFVFDNQMDFLNVAEKLGIGKAKVTLRKDVVKKGIGRALNGKRLLELVNHGQPGSSDSLPEEA